MTITTASTADAECVLRLQKLAYRSEALLYGDFSIPPLTQTLDDLRAEFATKTVLKALLNDQIVGSVRASHKCGTCFIERLIVHPDFQGQGIGTQLLLDIEACFPNAHRLELFTGHRSHRNIRLYERLGYRIFRQQPVNSSLSLVYLEKLKQAQPDA